MSPFLWNGRNRQIHTDGKSVSDCLGLGRAVGGGGGRRLAKGCVVPPQTNEHALKWT